jgi:hypothetical protein
LSCRHVDHHRGNQLHLKEYLLIHPDEADRLDPLTIKLLEAGDAKADRIDGRLAQLPA